MARTNPAGTQRRFNVVTMWMQRFDAVMNVVTTLKQRHVPCWEAVYSTIFLNFLDHTALH